MLVKFLMACCETLSKLLNEGRGAVLRYVMSTLLFTLLQHYQYSVLHAAARMRQMQYCCCCSSACYWLKLAVCSP
jgi:hypothetical protein